MTSKTTGRCGREIAEETYLQPTIWWNQTIDSRTVTKSHLRFMVLAARLLPAPFSGKSGLRGRADR
jgi:hypothetical protein